MRALCRIVKGIAPSMLLCVTACATSIVAIKGGNAVVIAADSTGFYPGSGSTTIQCKIFHTDSVYFASAGILQDNKAHIDFLQIEAAALAHHEPFKKKVARLEAEITPYIIRSATLMRSSRPEIYATRRYKFLEVLVAGVENGEVLESKRLARIDDSGERHLTVDFDRDDCGRGCRMIFTLGEHRAIDEHFRRQPLKYHDANEAAALARQMVQMEIVSEPHTVGPPIDILLINEDGPQWMQVKNECR